MNLLQDIKSNIIKNRLNDKVSLVFEGTTDETIIFSNEAETVEESYNRDTSRMRGKNLTAGHLMSSEDGCFSAKTFSIKSVVIRDASDYEKNSYSSQKTTNFWRHYTFIDGLNEDVKQLNNRCLWDARVKKHAAAPSSRFEYKTSSEIVFEQDQSHRLRACEKLRTQYINSLSSSLAEIGKKIDEIDKSFKKSLHELTQHLKPEAPPSIMLPQLTKTDSRDFIIEGEVKYGISFENQNGRSPITWLGSYLEIEGKKGFKLSSIPTFYTKRDDITLNIPIRMIRLHRAIKLKSSSTIQSSIRKTWVGSEINKGGFLDFEDSLSDLSQTNNLKNHGIFSSSAEQPEANSREEQVEAEDVQRKFVA